MPRVGVTKRACDRVGTTHHEVEHISFMTQKTIFKIKSDKARVPSQEHEYLTSFSFFVIVNMDHG